MLPLQIGEIALACKGEAHGEAQVTSVCIDSRKISQGCLFIAIKGDRFDGHDFVEKAFEEGAAAVMVHRDIHCRGHCFGWQATTASFFKSPLWV